MGVSHPAASSLCVTGLGGNHPIIRSAFRIRDPGYKNTCTKRHFKSNPCTCAVSATRLLKRAYGLEEWIDGPRRLTKPIRF